MLLCAPSSSKYIVIVVMSCAGSSSGGSGWGLPLPESFGGVGGGWRGIRVSSKYVAHLERVYCYYPSTLVGLSNLGGKSQSDLVKRLGRILLRLRNTTLEGAYSNLFGELLEQVRYLSHDGLVADWLYSHVEGMEEKYDLFEPMLERKAAFARYLELQSSCEACARLVGRYDNIVKGGKRVGSLDPNTVAFIDMYAAEMGRLSELQDDFANAERRFEAAQSLVSSVRQSIDELGLHLGYKLDTGLFG